MELNYHLMQHPTSVDAVLEMSIIMHLVAGILCSSCTIPYSFHILHDWHSVECEMNMEICSVVSYYAMVVIIEVM